MVRAGSTGACTGRAGTHTGSAVSALELHYECTQSALGALGPILGALGLYWDCTWTAAAQTCMVLGALDMCWECWGLYGDLTLTVSQAGIILGAFGPILGSYLESCDPDWHSIGSLGPYRDGAGPYWPYSGAMVVPLTAPCTSSTSLSSSVSTSRNSRSDPRQGPDS